MFVCGACFLFVFVVQKWCEMCKFSGVIVQGFGVDFTSAYQLNVWETPQILSISCTANGTENRVSDQ